LNDSWLVGAPKLRREEGGLNDSVASWGSTVGQWWWHGLSVTGGKK